MAALKTFVLTLFLPCLYCELLHPPPPYPPSAPPTLENFLATHSYQTAFKGCAKVIYYHHRGRYSATTFNSYRSVLVTSSYEPIVVKTDLHAPHIWPLRAACQIHVTLVNMWNAMIVTTASQKLQKDSRAEFEYFLVIVASAIPIMRTDNVDSQLQRIFSMSRILTAPSLRWIHNWGIFCTEHDESEHESMSAKIPILISHVYSVKLYCSADEIACLNKLDLATKPGGHLWSAMFPRSGHRIGIGYDNQGFPLLLYRKGSRRKIGTSHKYWTSQKQRSLYGLDPVLYLSILNKASTEIANAMNSSLVDYYFAFQPLSVLATYESVGSIRGTFEDLIVGMVYLDFVHCGSVTGELEGGVFAAFIPFEWPVWTCLGITISLLCPLLGLSSKGKTFILAVLAPLTSQSTGIPKRLGPLALLWLLLCFIIQNNYTCFIESIMLAPAGPSGVLDFEDLHAKGFHVAIAGNAGFLPAEFRKGNKSSFGGISHINALRENAVILRPGGRGYGYENYLRHIIGDDKGAFVAPSDEVTTMKRAAKEALVKTGGSIVCQQGLKKPYLAITMRAYYTNHPNAHILRKVIHHYFVTGITTHFESISTEVKNNALARGTRDALSFIVEPRSTNNGTQGEANGESSGLSYTQTTSIFYAWLSACALSLAVLILEFVYVYGGGFRSAAKVFMAVLMACKVKRNFCQCK